MTHRQSAGTGAQESGVRSQEFRSQESGGQRVRESGVQESGVRSQEESGVRSQEPGARNAESHVRPNDGSNKLDYRRTIRA